MIQKIKFLILALALIALWANKAMAQPAPCGGYTITFPDFAIWGSDGNIYVGQIGVRDGRHVAAITDYCALVNPNLVIPSTVVMSSGATYTVTDMFPLRFNGFANISITSVILPDSLISISGGMFKNDLLLTSVTFPATLKAIGDYNNFINADGVFEGCTALQIPAFPDSLQFIGSNSFKGCSGSTVPLNLSNISIIGGSAFEDCSSIPSIFFADTADIYRHAFAGCSSLTTLSLPVPREEGGWMHGDEFADCTGLTSITLPGAMKIINSGMFRNCTAISSINLDSVLSYGNGAFMGAFVSSYNLVLGENCSIGEDAFNGSRIASVTFPECLGVDCAGEWYRDIYFGSFANCPNLVTVNYNSIATGSSIIGSISLSVGRAGAVFGNSPVQTINVGNKVKILPGFWEGNTTVKILNANNADSLRYIGSFDNCTALEEITIPLMVEQVLSFRNCPRLATINHNAKHCNSIYNVSSYEDEVATNPWLFWDAGSSPEVTKIRLNFGDSVKFLGLAFYTRFGSRKIDTLTIPENMEYISGRALAMCNPNTVINWNARDCITDISYDDYTIWEPYADFSNVNIGSTCRVIPANSFTKTSITSITIPDSVTHIGEYAFYYCPNLTTLNFNAANCTADYGAFFVEPRGWITTNPLTTLNIGAKVHTLPCDEIFRNAITTINLDGNNADFIMNNGILWNKNQTSLIYNTDFDLRTITIGSSVDTIGSRAFYSCTQLDTVYIEATIPPTLLLHYYDLLRSFHKIPQSAVLVVPCGSLSLYQSSAWSSCFNHIVENCTSNVVSVTGITINPTSKTIGVGETLQLSANILPANATNKNIDWQATPGWENKISIISITNGMLTIQALAAGTLDIYALSEENESIYAACQVTITHSSGVAVTGITINPTSTTIRVGETLQLSANILPANATNKNIDWQATTGWESKVNLVSITNETLTIQALATGTLDIYALSEEDGSIYAVCQVTITHSSGIDEVLANKVFIYPNPVEDELKIEIGDFRINSVEILDITGKAISSHQSEIVNSVDVSHLSSGVYLIKINTDKGTKTERFIKK